MTFATHKITALHIIPCHFDQKGLSFAPGYGDVLPFQMVAELTIITDRIWIWNRAVIY